MPIEFKQRVLDNGLTIIAESDPSAHSAAIGFFVRAGARDESSAIMGVSHFLEHMMFKGTEQRSGEQVDRDFDDIGADHNAYTTSELTAFWCHCLPEHLERGESILADILRPSIRPADFDNEKKVILEEIAMYQDNPFWVLYENAMESYYGKHPLSHRVLGTADTVAAMKRDEMAAYFEHRYSADNTVVAMAGRVDFDKIASEIETHCGGWQRTGAVRAYPEAPTTADDFTHKSATVNRHYLLMLAPAPALGDDRRYAAAILAQILGDDDGSRLYWALVETGLAEDAIAQYDPHDGIGEYIMFASCSPGEAEVVEGTMRGEADKLVGSLTDDDLLRVRSKVATGATLAAELPAGRMRRLGRQWTYLGEYRSLEDELARINAVTLDDLRAVHEAFPIAPRVVARLTPDGEGTPE